MANSVLDDERLNAFPLRLGLERAHGERNGNPLQYSCLENYMDRGACLAIALGVANSWT